MARIYDQDSIRAAIWDNPTPAIGLTFRRTKDGRGWESSQRLDGTESKDQDKTTLGFYQGELMVRSNDERFKGSQSIWDALKYVYSTNDIGEVYRRAAEAYGIQPDLSGLSETHRQRMQRRAEDAPIIAEVAKYLTAALASDKGAPARDYLAQRGLQPSERLGAFSAAIRSDLLAHLQKCFPSLSVAQIRKKIDGLLRTKQKNTEEDFADDYALVIPYLNGGRIAGFVLRMTAQNKYYIDADGQRQEKTKYSNSLSFAKGGSFERAGYCGRLDTSKPVLLVEGMLDAERCQQAGFSNVIALGGQTPTAGKSEEDAAGSVIETLKRYGAKKLVYIPDYEHEVLKDAGGNVIGYGQLKTKATIDTIGAIAPHLTGKDDGRGFRWLKIAQLYNTSRDDKQKQDADSFIRDFGKDAFQAVISTAKPWYLWRFETAAASCVGEDLQAEALDIYTSVNSPLDREVIKQNLTGAASGVYAKLKAVGMTPASLRAIDAGADASTYRQKMTEIAEQLTQAVQGHATADTIGGILKKAARLQNAGEQAQMSAILNADRDYFETLVRNKGEELETPWALYDKRGNEIRKISFPAGYYSIIAAPTGYGKTSFLMQTALYFAQNTRKRFVFASMEEDAEQLYIRSLAAYMGGKGYTGAADLWTKNADGYSNPKGELRRIIRMNGATEDLPLWTKNADKIEALTEDYFREVRPNLRVMFGRGGEVDSLCNNIAAVLEDWKADGVEIGGVFFDYIQLMRQAERSYSRTEEIFTICTFLNDFAKELQIPVIMGCQMNRDATKTDKGVISLDKINLTNLGDSSGIERTAAEVYMLIRPEYIIPAKDIKGNFASIEGRRTRRCCIGSEHDSPKIREHTLYIENLKARGYATDGYALIEWDAATGAIKLRSDKAQSEE